MKATTEVSAVGFVRRIEAKSKSISCDLCNRRFIRTAYYKHKKSKPHLATLNEKIISNIALPNKGKNGHQSQI